MDFKRISWAIKRHPFLYLTRFWLLSKNSNIDDIARCSYNITNLKTDIPSYFKQVNSDIFNNYQPTNDFEKVIHLSKWLREHIKGGPGLSVPSEDALRLMLAGKGGVCSDLVQIFNNFCVLNDIKVREWGVTRTPFDKSFGGHSFNEVYVSELEKWVLVDVSKCIMFYENGNKKPLSVIELYEGLRQNNDIMFKSFYESRHSGSQSIISNFFDENSMPFLICNYKGKTYDRFLKLTGSVVPVFVTHFIIYVALQSYHYRFPLDDYRKIFS